MLVLLFMGKLFPYDTLPISINDQLPVDSPSSFVDLYQLSPDKINRLINLKYNNDPIGLIKQLSLELAQKNQELSHLHQQIFVKDQKFYKLLTQYSNLLTLEIDHQLLKLVINKNNDTNLNHHEDNHIANEKPDNNSGYVSEPKVKGHKSEDDISTNDRNYSQNRLKQEGKGPQDEQVKTKTRENGGIKARQIEKTQIEQTQAKRNDIEASSIGGNQVEGEKSKIMAKVSNELEGRSSEFTGKNGLIVESKHNGKGDRNINQEVLPRPSSLSMIPSWVKNITRYNSDDEIHKNKSKPSKVSLSDNSVSLNHVDDKIPLELERLKNDYKDDQSLFPLIDELPNDDNVDKYGFYINSSSIKYPNNSSGSNQAILINNRKSYLQSIGQLIEISKIHDSTTLNYEYQWESLLNDINRMYYKGNEKSELREKTNVDNLITSEKFGTHGLNILYESHDCFLQLINLIHKNGIPENYRYQLWLELTGAQNLRINGEYCQLVKDINNYLAKNDEIIQTNINQINLDVSRTFKNNYYFNYQINCSPGPHYYRLKRILYAFVAYKPNIGYCQGMNKIVGNLLILASYHNHNKSLTNKFTEEDVFWMFIGLIEEILPRYDSVSFFNALLNIRIDQIIIHQIYTKKFLPNLFIHLNNHNIQFELITMNWWLTLFIDLRFINLETWHKIFDTLIIDDSIKYRDIHNWKDLSANLINNDNQKAVKLIAITLSIFKCLEQFLLSLHDTSSIYRYLDGNNSSKFYDEKDQEIKIQLKYSEILTYYDDYMKKIDLDELIQHRINWQSQDF